MNHVPHRLIDGSGTSARLSRERSILFWMALYDSLRALPETSLIRGRSGSAEFANWFRTGPDSGAMPIEFASLGVAAAPLWRQFFGGSTNGED